MRYLIILSLLVIQLLSGCLGKGVAPSKVPAGDNVGPVITDITTSSKGFSIDCIPTSMTVTANITDSSAVEGAVLWYRVGTDQPYTPVDMDSSAGNNYNTTIKALDIPVGKSGRWEFYITVQDKVGNQSQSPLDTSVQLLLCVSH